VDLGSTHQAICQVEEEIAVQESVHDGHWRLRVCAVERGAEQQQGVSSCSSAASGYSLGYMWHVRCCEVTDDRWVVVG
jgi:hypothetical protein